MTRHIISDAAKILNVETHVLRNWEDELSLNIPRNELGHRIYTNDDIEQLKLIKRFKLLGFSLKHIKLLLPYMDKLRNIDDTALNALHSKLTKELSAPDTSIDKIEHFKLILNDSLTHFFNNYLRYISQEFISHTTDELNKTLSFHLSKHQTYIQEYYNLLHNTKKKRH